VERLWRGEAAVMFLRKNRKRFEGEVYEYWTLCETVRTERGPRQRVVASLGKFTEEDLSAGWDELEALLDGRKPAPRQRHFGEAPNPTAKPAPGARGARRSARVGAGGALEAERRARARVRPRLPGSCPVAAAGAARVARRADRTGPRGGALGRCGVNAPKSAPFRRGR
jgi:hypothetical protein